MAKTYVKRPIHVEAIQWTGDNWREILDWAGNITFWAFEDDEMPNDDDPEATAAVFDLLHSSWILLRTGDWILKGTKGEFYLVNSTVFAEIYSEFEVPDGQ